MVAVMRYTVTAERGAGQVWVFQCKEYPGAISESRRLSDVFRLMPEAIAYVADVDENDVEIVLVPVLPQPVADQVEHARAAVETLAQHQLEAGRLSREAANRLVHFCGLTGTDTATILGVSPQRVSQLISDARLRETAEDLAKPEQEGVATGQRRARSLITSA